MRFLSCVLVKLSRKVGADVDAVDPDAILLRPPLLVAVPVLRNESAVIVAVVPPSVVTVVATVANVTDVDFLACLAGGQGQRITRDPGPFGPGPACSMIIASVLKIDLETVVHGILPRCVVHRCHRPGYHRFVGVVAEGHDVLLLVLLPLVEGLAGALHDL